MSTIADVINYVEGLAGHALNPDEGVHHGDVSARVSGVTVAWMATPEAVEAAGAAGHELLLVHESLYFPYDAIVRTDLPDSWQDWQVNCQRRDLMEKFNINCLRVHGSLDEICIFDDFARLLGLGTPVFSDGLVKVFDIEPASIAELIDRAKKASGMARVRVCLPHNTPESFSRVGLAWGGMGLFVNIGYMQRLLEQGCDVLIGGESDDYAFRFVQECGVSFIETSHEVSENPGLKSFSTRVQGAFPDLDVGFYENKCPWTVR